MKEKGSNKGESVTYMYMKFTDMYVTLSAHEYVNIKGFQSRERETKN